MLSIRAHDGKAYTRAVVWQEDFAKFSTAIKENKDYEFHAVTVTEFNGRKELKLSSKSKVIEAEGCVTSMTLVYADLSNVIATSDANDNNDVCVDVIIAKLGRSKNKKRRCVIADKTGVASITLFDTASDAQLKEGDIACFQRLKKTKTGELGTWTTPKSIENDALTNWWATKERDTYTDRICDLPNKVNGRAVVVCVVDEKKPQSTSSKSGVARVSLVVCDDSDGGRKIEVSCFGESVCDHVSNNVTVGSVIELDAKVSDWNRCSLNVYDASDVTDISNKSLEDWWKFGDSTRLVSVSGPKDDYEEQKLAMIGGDNNLVRVKGFIVSVSDIVTLPKSGAQKLNLTLADESNGGTCIEISCFGTQVTEYASQLSIGTLLEALAKTSTYNECSLKVFESQQISLLDDAQLLESNTELVEFKTAWLAHRVDGIGDPVVLNKMTLSSHNEAPTIQNRKLSEIAAMEEYEFTSICVAVLKIHKAIILAKSGVSKITLLVADFSEGGTCIEVSCIGDDIGEHIANHVKQGDALQIRAKKSNWNQCSLTAYNAFDLKKTEPFPGFDDLLIESDLLEPNLTFLSKYEREE